MHAKHSPSGAASGWGLCPARISIPGRPAGQAAEDGTRRHALFEYWVTKNLDGGWSHWPTEWNGFKFTSDDVAAVKSAIEWVSKHPAFIGAKVKTPGHHVFVEQMVHFDRAFGYDDADDYLGTADLILITPEVFEIADLKTGFQFVDPTDNFQLYLYKVGAVSDPKFPFSSNMVQRLTVIQPAFNPVARSWDIDAASDQRLALTVRQAIEASNESPPRRVPGEKQCKYCTEAGTCAERLLWVSGQLREAFGPVNPITTEEPMSSEVTKASTDVLISSIEELAVKKPESLTPEDAARVIELASIVVPLFEAVKSTWRDKALQGIKLPGLKLIAGRKSRVYTHDEETIAAKVKNMGFKKAEYMKEVLLSPAQLDKLAAAKLTDRQYRNFQGLIRWEEGKPQLVPEDDPHPALEIPSFGDTTSSTPIITVEDLI